MEKENCQGDRPEFAGRYGEDIAWKIGLNAGDEEDIPAGSYTAEVNIYEAGQSIVKEYVMEVN